MNNENHTVKLKNGTVGLIPCSSIDFKDINEWIGEYVTVLIHDVHGCPVEVYGILESILEVAYTDQ